MTIPFGQAAAALRGAGGEAAALAHHLLRYPTGVGGNRPATSSRSADNHPSVGPVAGDNRPSGDNPAAADGCPARPVTAPPHHGPVLLLHGLADNRAVFTPLVRHLHRHGWTHLHALNHSPLTADVRAAAVLLARHVEWAARAHGGRPVTLIGHSLGGLIARYYVQRLGGGALAPHVVTLGTPHEGTAVARLPVLLPVTRQLRPGSELLVELGRPAPDCAARFTAIGAELDEIVVPRRSAWVHHPDLRCDNLQIPGVGHLGLPVHPLTLAAVRRALSEGGPEGELTERHAC